MVERSVRVETVSGATPPRGHRVVRVVGAVVLAGHGVVHLLGVALLWRLGQPGELRYADVHPAAGSAAGLAAGAVWLAVVVLFVLAAVLLVVWRRQWRRVAGLAAIVSVAVLVPSASIVTAGLVVDVAVLAAVTATSPWFRAGRR